jgi:hypothetical protein
MEHKSDPQRPALRADTSEGSDRQSFSRVVLVRHLRGAGRRKLITIGEKMIQIAISQAALDATAARHHWL